MDTLASIWPWLAVAGSGAMHGLSPGSGWMFAAAWSARSRDRSLLLQALLPIAAGYLAAVLLAAAATARGLPPASPLLQTLAAGLLLAFATVHWCGHHSHRAPAGHAGLALWSFVMSTAQGMGMMLAPALIPLCIGQESARGMAVAGSPALALAAVGLHIGAMLAVTAVMATGACRALDLGTRLLQAALRTSRLRCTETGNRRIGSLAASALFAQAEPHHEPPPSPTG